jgi:hypothetical protein
MFDELAQFAIAEAVDFKIARVVSEPIAQD